MNDIVKVESEQEVPPPNCTPATGSPCTGGNTTLGSCYHYDSFISVCVTGLKTAGRIRMAVSVMKIMLDMMHI
jgi:hypothetical protein